MTRITRYAKRIRFVFISGLIAAGLTSIFAIPFADNRLLKIDVGYIAVELDGNLIGTANSFSDAEEALADARKKFGEEYENVVFMEENLDFIKKNVIFSRRMSTEELTQAIYSALFECVTDIEKKVAYAIRIGDITVNLASLNEVTELVERLVEEYDVDKEYNVIVKPEQADSSIYTVVFDKKIQSDSNNDIIASIIDGASSVVTEDGSSTRDSLIDIYFDEDVQVVEIDKRNSLIMTVDEAYDAVKTSTAADLRYIVKANDSLDLIAYRYGITKADIVALNEGLTMESVVVPGEIINITYQKPALTVVCKKRVSQEEEYFNNVYYKEDTDSYFGTNSLIQSGVAGHRKVTADITYINGVKVSEDVIEQEIITEAVTEIINMGTKSLGEFSSPLYGGTLIASFGDNDGVLCEGERWAIPEGNDVKASGDGTVVKAGWSGRYGYLVEIEHKDGVVTRYAHLNSISVNVGDTVIKGQLIAVTGSTGDCSEPMLYFEVLKDGKAVNPEIYVGKN